MGDMLKALLSSSDFPNNSPEIGGIEHFNGVIEMNLSEFPNGSASKTSCWRQQNDLIGARDATFFWVTADGKVHRHENY